MYEDFSELERAIIHFGNKVDIVVALEMGNKITEEQAYKQIKDLYKELKKLHKAEKKNDNKAD